MINKISQFILLTLLFTALPVQAETSLSLRLAGKILLEVESRGQAWYVNPKDQKKYFLGKPLDAFNLMRTFGIGITDENLTKISVGQNGYPGADNDADGLPDDLELALGTDPRKNDTDGDGFNDLVEIGGNYNPAGPGKTTVDKNFAQKNTGKLFLQVENRGQCWYVSPSDNKRYYLGSPAQAFSVIKKLGLGISNNDIDKIANGYFYNQPAAPASSAPGPMPNPVPSLEPSANAGQPIYQAGEAIRNNDTEKVVTYFSANLAPVIRYTMGFLSSEGRFIWSQMLSGSTLLSSSATVEIYHNYVYFQDEKIEIKYHVKKQPNGQWLITNL